MNNQFPCDNFMVDVFAADANICKTCGCHKTLHLQNSAKTKALAVEKLVHQLINEIVQKNSKNQKRLNMVADKNKQINLFFALEKQQFLRKSMTIDQLSPFQEKGNEELLLIIEKQKKEIEQLRNEKEQLSNENKRLKEQFGMHDDSEQTLQLMQSQFEEWENQNDELNKLLLIQTEQINRFVKDLKAKN